MSSKSKMKPKSMNRRRYEAARTEKYLATKKNHVSEKDLSPGGFPFHFAGPKKAVRNVNG